MKKVYNKIAKSGVFLVGAAFIVSSCSKKNPQSPGFEFMPDMYYSVGYDAYQKNPVFANGTTAQDPVEGTMPYQSNPANVYNVLPYAYPNTNEGYEAANALKSPLAKTEANLKEGERLFKTFCSHCHGATGMGDGKVGTINPALIPPAYNSELLAGLSEGKIFHVITYGKGMMGAHQYQINKLDRWKIVQYVQTLQATKAAAAAPAAASTDSTTAAAQ